MIIGEMQDKQDDLFEAPPCRVASEMHASTPIKGTNKSMKDVHSERSIASKLMLDDSRAEHEAEGLSKDGNVPQAISAEAKLILESTQELNQTPNIQHSLIHGADPNLKHLSIEQLMASQLSLDSSRLGQLQDDRIISTPIAEGFEAGASSVNDMSLFAELSNEDASLLENSPGAGFVSSTKEFEEIIQENKDLLASK